MRKKIILISKNKQEAEILNGLLDRQQYSLHPIDELEKICEGLIKSSSNCLILDLDTIRVDSRALKKLTVLYPQVYFLCISKDRFHPELKEVIWYHIYACLTKPLDGDELLYWLKCIEDEVNGSYGKL